MQSPSGLLSAAVVAVPSSRLAVATTGTGGFFQLLVAFCLGGLFFSTVIAAVSACYAVGMENVRFLGDILSAILHAIWLSFTAALGTAKATLLLAASSSSSSEEEDTKKASWQWRQAWRVLKQELVKTRQTAAEGVAVLREEAALYAGVVGAPGLIPLQYVIDRFLPFAIAGALETSLKESLADMPQKTRSITAIKLTDFCVGSKSPQLEAARAYELGEDGVAFDCEIDWPSDMQVKLTVYTAAGLARIPVVVKNIQFTGVLRVIFTPLVKQAPGYGAVLVSFPRKAPNIGLDVRVAGGDITRIPWLRSEVVSAIQKGIADELLWPKRVVVPTMVRGPGGREVPFLTKKELAQLATSDPLLVKEEALAARPVIRQQMEKSKPQLSSLKQQFKVFVNRKPAQGEAETEDLLERSSTEVSVSTRSTTIRGTEALHDRRSMTPEERRRLAKTQRGVLWTTLRGLGSN
jgi:hypothetical protein